MNIFQSIISEEWITILGSSLLHSLWQGALIALLLGVTLFFLQKKSSNLRYVLSASSLVLVLVVFLGTFIYLYQNTTTPSITDTTYTVITMDDYNQISQSSITTQETSSSVFLSYFQEHLPVIVILWLLGVLILSLRFLGGVAYVQRLKHAQNRPLSNFWSNKMLDISTRLNVKKPVKLLESALISVPMVIGYLKPIVLLPIGTITALSQAEVEAILAHELAHIRRHDYLINLIQSMIDVLFFYHPAIWWMSNTVRAERENCCDDLALQITGNSLIIAKALANLEAVRLSSPLLSVAFTGQKNQLLNRISRLLGQQKKKNNFIEGFIAVAIIIICLTAMNYKVNAKNDFNEITSSTMTGIDTIIPKSTNVEEEEEEEEEGEVIEEYIIIEEEIEIPTPPMPSWPQLITLENGKTAWVNGENDLKLAHVPSAIAPPKPIKSLKIVTLSNGQAAWIDTKHDLKLASVPSAIAPIKPIKSLKIITLSNGKTAWVDANFIVPDHLEIKDFTNFSKDNLARINEENSFFRMPSAPNAPSLKWELKETSQHLFKEDHLNHDLINNATQWTFASEDTLILDRIDDNSEIIIIDGDETIIIRKKKKTRLSAKEQRKVKALERQSTTLKKKYALRKSQQYQQQAERKSKEAQKRMEQAHKELEKNKEKFHQEHQHQLKNEQKRLKAENERVRKELKSKQKHIHQQLEAERKHLKERLEREKVIRKEERKQLKKVKTKRSRSEAQRRKIKERKEKKKIKKKILKKELVKDGLLKEGQTLETINVSIENDKKTIRVNGKSIPKDKIDKYINIIKD